MAVIGGLARIEGAWVGAFAFIVIQNYVRDSSFPLLGFGGTLFGGSVQHGHRDHLPADRARLARRADGHLGPSASPLGARIGRAGRAPSACRDRRAARRRASRAAEVELRQAAGRESRAIDNETGRAPDEEIELAELAAAALAAWIAVGVALIGGVSTSFAASQARDVVRVAIMTDCKGAFGFGYELDIGGRRGRASRSTRTARPKNKKKPSAGMTGINAGGANVKIVGYGCGNDTVPLAVTETKRLMEQLKADVMIGPLSGDEAVSVAQLREVAPDEDVHHRDGRARRIRRCRSRRRTCSATTATAPSGTRAPARSPTGSSAGGRPRSSWTTTASAGRPPPA